MKTVKRHEEIRRVSDAEALKMTTDQGWNYVPKSVWKKAKNEKVKNTRTELLGGLKSESKKKS